MCLWISLLSVNEARKENWIANEEDWRVVSDLKFVCDDPK
jgi:hypothetical protein